MQTVALAHFLPQIMLCQPRTVKNVTFSNITATGGQPGSTQDESAGGGCRVKSRPNSTGTVSDIRYEDMLFKDVYWPLQLLGHCETTLQSTLL